MATLAELQKMRADLVAARASSARQVRDETGAGVTYKSDREMASAIAAIDAEMAALIRGPRSSVIRVSTSKGLT